MPATADQITLIRMKIGDTDLATQMFSDAQINIVYDTTLSVNLCAASLCDMAAAKFARSAIDKQISKTSISASQLFNHYVALAKQLREFGSSDDGSGVPDATLYFTGISLSDRERIQSDSNSIQSRFRLGQDDHPLAIQMPLSSESE